MRALLAPMPAVLLGVACGEGPARQDTPEATAAPALADERTDAMSGAAATSVDSASGLPRVLLLGTSLTAGLGLDPTDAYPAILQRKADSAGYAVRIVNAGLSGETSAGALRRLDWLLREPAALVMIETGANDGLRGVDVDSTRANLEAIVAGVQATLPGATVLLVEMEAPPNLGEDYTRRFRDNYARVARQAGIELVPFLLEGVAGVRSMNQGDGIHPTREGARRVAENVWGVLAPHLARLANRKGSS